MALKRLKPVTPSSRGVVLVDKSKLWKGGPLKSLSFGMPSTGGRNNQGRITVRHRGYRKTLYRMIDFKRDKIDMSAKVLRLEYDPNRTAFIALLEYEDGVKSYIIAPHNLKEGDTIVSSIHAEIKIGNCLPIGRIPVTTMVHNVEMKPGKGGQMAKSAGTFAQVVGREDRYMIIELPSKERRKIFEECRATIGVASNADLINVNLGKAGRTIWAGRRPHVRGAVMNPVDHPLGGRTRGGKHPVSPTGQPAKGYKTRIRRRTSDSMIVQKRSFAKRK